MTTENTKYMIARGSTILAALQRTTDRLAELPWLMRKEVERTPPETRRYTEISFKDQIAHEQQIQQKLLELLGRRT